MADGFQSKKYVVMRLTHARHLTRFNYILGDKPRQETDNHPYLGVHITKDLTWIKHIHQITASSNRTHASNIILKNLPTQLLFVHFLDSHHPYGTTIPRHSKKKIENGLKTCSSLCHNDYKTIENGGMFEMIRTLNLEL